MEIETQEMEYILENYKGYVVKQYMFLSGEFEITEEGFKDTLSGGVTKIKEWLKKIVEFLRKHSKIMNKLFTYILKLLKNVFPKTKSKKAKKRNVRIIDYDISKDLIKKIIVSLAGNHPYSAVDNLTIDEIRNKTKSIIVNSSEYRDFLEKAKSENYEVDPDYGQHEVIKNYENDIVREISYIPTPRKYNLTIFSNSNKICDLGEIATKLSNLEKACSIVERNVINGKTNDSDANSDLFDGGCLSGVITIRNAQLDEWAMSIDDKRYYELKERYEKQVEKIENLADKLTRATFDSAELNCFREPIAKILKQLNGIGDILTRDVRALLSSHTFLVECRMDVTNEIVEFIEEYGSYLFLEGVRNGR